MEFKFAILMKRQAMTASFPPHRLKYFSENAMLTGLQSYPAVQIIMRMQKKDQRFPVRLENAG